MNEQGILLESGTNEMELLTVLVNDQPLGMNVAKVKSIQQYDPELVTSLPDAHPFIAGTLLYRDKNIPLLDLAKILDVELDAEPEREIVVVTEFNNAVNSFKVQGVQRIHRLSWKSFVPIDGIFNNSPHFTGSVDVEDALIMVLDLEYIIANIFPHQVIEDVDDDTIGRGRDVTRDMLEIVFAEDSSTIRKSVISALQKSGFKNITGFINGDQALTYMRGHFKGQRDMSKVVLITDIEMPQMDGLTLCRRVKNDPDLRDIYVIMFSSLINSQMISKCESVNAQNYVTKPETNQLIRILDERCS